MNKFLKATLFFLLSTLFAAPVFAYDAELFAGQTILVGHVNVTVSGGDVIVTYFIDPPNDEYWQGAH